MNKILFFIKLPPPLSGATFMNELVLNSHLFQSSFSIVTIPISYKKNLVETKTFSFKKIVKILFIYLKLIKYLIVFNPKLIYFQVSPIGIAFLRDFTYILIIKIFKKHILFHLHGKGIKEYINGSIIKRKLFQLAFKNTEIICLSKYLIHDIENVYKGKPYIVPNGIPVDIHYKTNSKNLPKINILFFSNLFYSKGIIVYLDAIKLLNDKRVGPYIQGNIIGKEAEVDEKKLESEISKRNIQNVKYLGPKYGNDKIKVLSKMDILVYPTLNDAWGLVILEAMQIGLPVIATREGAIPEIVENGVTGFIIEKNNPDQIAEKLEILIKNPELRKKMGTAGRKRFLEKYTLKIFEQNMKKVFDNVLEKLS